MNNQWFLLGSMKKDWIEIMIITETIFNRLKFVEPKTDFQATEQIYEDVAGFESIRRI